MGFQQGNQAARLGRGKSREAVIVTSIKQYIRDNTPWEKILKALLDLSLGGKKIKNANGITYRTRPDLNAIKLLLEYSYGKPDILQTLDTSAADTLTEFNKIAKEVLLPAQKPLSSNAVNSEGQLVSDTQQPS